MKQCECGCEQTISSGARWVRGHNIRNGMAPWLKETPSYGALHTWLRKHYPKTKVCDECGAFAATDYALIHEKSTHETEVSIASCAVAATFFTTRSVAADGEAS